MSKGIGPLAVGLVAIIAVLGLEYIFVSQMIFKTEIYRATAREANVLEGINQVELTKDSLADAAKYSYTQAAYTTGNLGGFIDLNGVESFSCTPYWRFFNKINEPDEESSMKWLMDRYLNEYSLELNGEVSTSRYNGFNLDARDKDVGFDALGSHPLSLSRQKLQIRDVSDTRNDALTYLHKMFREGKRLFITQDEMQRRVELADATMPHLPPGGVEDYKSQYIDSHSSDTDGYCEDQLPDTVQWIIEKKKKAGEKDPRVLYEEHLVKQLGDMERDIEALFDNKVDVTVDLTTLDETGVYLVNDPSINMKSSWHTRIRIDATKEWKKEIPDFSCGCNNWQDKITGYKIDPRTGESIPIIEKFCEPKDYKKRYESVTYNYFYNTIAVVYIKMEDKDQKYVIWDPEKSRLDEKPLFLQFYATNGKSEDIGLVGGLDGLRQKITNKPEDTCRGKSKLGFQTAFGTGSEMSFIEKTKPAVVKLIDAVDRAREIKQKSPNTVIVGRFYEADQPDIADVLRDKPEDMADAWFNRHEGAIKNNLLVDCWEGYNEPTPGVDPKELDWYAKFEIRRMQKLEAIGAKACIGNFGTGPSGSGGWPPLDNWKYFMGAVNHATRNGHYLGLHEYSYPRMDSNFGSNTGRYREVYSRYDLILPLIITETGIADLNKPDCETCGWRSVTTAEDYCKQLKWYDSELKKDGYVKGAAMFHYGLSGWEGFEISPELIEAGGKCDLEKYIATSATPERNIMAPIGGGDVFLDCSSLTFADGDPILSKVRLNLRDQPAGAVIATINFNTKGVARSTATEVELNGLKHCWIAVEWETSGGKVSGYSTSGPITNPTEYIEKISLSPIESPKPPVIPPPLGSGSCPVESAIITCGSYGTSFGVCPGGHGSNDYWTCIDKDGKPYLCYGSGTCGFRIGGYHGPTNSVDPDGTENICYSGGRTRGSTYGYALDVASSSGPGSPVFLPYVNGKSITWSWTGNEYPIDDGNNGYWRSYRGSDNEGSNYEIWLLHISKGEGYVENVQSGTPVGTLFDWGTRTHVHVELLINGNVVKPDFLCL